MHLLRETLRAGRDAKIWTYVSFRFTRDTVVHENRNGVLMPALESLEKVQGQRSVKTHAVDERGSKQMFRRGNRPVAGSLVCGFSNCSVQRIPKRASSYPAGVRPWS